MADVAREAGVSLSTVDRVLNLRAGVRADTAQRIARAAAKLGFHAQGVIEQRLRHDRPTIRLGFLLQKSGVAFYQGLAQALAEAAAATARARVRLMIGYLDDLDPLVVARRIEAQRGEVDALGVVAVDHVAVREAVSDLCLNGMPVLAMISELASRAGVGYIGVDNRRMGRVAGWFITHLASKPGSVAVMVGSQRFQCQELCELSFRSYMASSAEEWEPLASRLTLEDEHYAHANTLDLISAYPDLVGLYVAGGGIEGVIRALEELRSIKIKLPIVVCHDLTPVTRAALTQGLVQAVISHPVETLARRAIDALVTSALEKEQPGYNLLPLQIDVPESH
ncbi:LacI family DNA-binding transcriptional regulator [Pseudomonas sp. Marseille-Q7302]